MLSIPRLLAPSSSIMSIFLFSFASLHDSHSLQGVGVGAFAHTSAFAIILAVDVLPLPRSPLNR